MTSVALIGSDGAGKSRVAEELTRSFPARTKSLYMGMNPDSGRFALPTTRLSHRLKKRRAAGAHGSTRPISLHSIEHRKDSRGPIWATARLANRVAEELLKQVISVMYQLGGAIVVYDRHYLFDFTPSSDRPQRLTSRIHLWFLERVYPKPDLVIFLDAEPDVLLARKREVPESYLQARRAAFLARGATTENFVVVDAGRPFGDVYRDVADEIEHLIHQRRGRTTTQTEGNHSA